MPIDDVEMPATTMPPPKKQKVVGQSFDGGVPAVPVALRELAHAAGEQVNPSSWVARIQEALASTREQMGEQVVDAVVHSLCSGTGAPTIGLKEMPASLSKHRN